MSRRRRRSPAADRVPVLTDRDLRILNDLRRGLPVDRTKPAVRRAIARYRRILLHQHDEEIRQKRDDQRARGVR
jgi:hypothetical protein